MSTNPFKYVKLPIRYFCHQSIIAFEPLICFSVPWPRYPMSILYLTYLTYKSKVSCTKINNFIPYLDDQQCWPALKRIEFDMSMIVSINCLLVYNFFWLLYISYLILPYISDLLREDLKSYSLKSKLYYFTTL